MEPINVLANNAQITLDLIVGNLTAKCRSLREIQERPRRMSNAMAQQQRQRTCLDVVDFMNGFGRWKNVAHDDKMNLPSPGQLDPMKPDESGKKRIGIVLDMIVVML